MRTDKTEKKLVEKALKTLKHSHSPHSKFKVGAALLGQSGKMYAGTNIEFDAFTLTVCAERSALFTAISTGEKKFSKIAIATSSGDFIYPCGLCRQALVEFNPELEVILITKQKKVKRFILKEVIPNYFKL
jgi:cytidine deaminase